MLRGQYVKTVLAGYLLWPLAHIINFKFVPADLRILYVNWYSFAGLLSCLCAHAIPVSHNAALDTAWASEQVIHSVTDYLHQQIMADKRT